MSLLWSFSKNTSCVFLLAYSPSGAGTPGAKKWCLNYPTIAPEGQNVNRNRITRYGCAPEVRYLVGFFFISLLWNFSKKYYSEFLLTCRPAGANIHFYPFPICLLVRKPAPEEQHVNRKSQIQYLARSGGALLICFPTSPQSILKSVL